MTNIQPQLDWVEHEELLRGKRTALYGWDDGGLAFRRVAVDSSGRLEVAVVSGGGAGTEFTDGDAVDTDSQGTLMMGATGVPGTARAARVDDDGALHVADGGNSLTVDGSVSVSNFPGTQPVSGTVTANQGTDPWIVAATALDIRALDSGTDSVAAELSVGGNLVGKVQLRNPGDTADLGDATNPVRTDPTGSTTQPVSGTVTVQDGGGSLTVDGGVDVQGEVAHDDADSGDPVKIGGRARDTYEQVAEDDRTDAWLDRLGRQVVVTGAQGAMQQVHVELTNTTETEVIAAPGAGDAILVCGMLVTTNEAEDVLELSVRSNSIEEWAAYISRNGGGWVLPLGGDGWQMDVNEALDVALGSTPNNSATVHVVVFYKVLSNG